MSKLQVTNTLTRKKEEFKPIDPQNVGMYVCGPTVYDRPHLGNARAAVIYDLLFRTLKTLYTTVTYTRNITDVDDKIIIASKASGEPVNELTKRITEYYHADIAAIGCLAPTYEPKATDNIQNMIDMIGELIAKKHAYVEQSHVLFDTGSFKEYGCLSHRSRDEMIAGARVEVAPYKKDPADFVLWKPTPEDEFEYGFDSPWGRGRPGWHIECSAMSKANLGMTFDIHGGGADLMFPHHENELAQSYCANGHGNFAKYWIHNGFLTVEGEKMSKSLGNFFTVNEVLEQGVSGAAIRCLYLGTHYRKPLDYNKKALSDANLTLQKLQQSVKNLPAEECPIPDEILHAMYDDLNTPLAMAKLHELAALALKGEVQAGQKIKSACEFLGIDLTVHSKEIPGHIIELANARLKAKADKNWLEADRLRDEIISKGFNIKDTKDGFEIL